MNSKYLKIKQNQKLGAKFFELFRVWYPVGKQAYIIEFPKKWKIHNVFQVLLLEQYTTKKGQVEIAINLDESGNKEYEVKAICDSTVYTSKSESHLSGLYYLVLYKSYPKEKNTWEPTSVI